MSLYRILLVDDEAEIRDGIIRKIDWASCGFELVGDAENGQDALELAQRLHPDLVMTDIKMPFMDGLELCKILCEQMPAVKLLIFSGFDDFEYAQQAIKVNVAEYILKPINASELMKVLCKLKEDMDREISEKRNVEILREHYIQSLPIIRDQFLTGLVEGRVPAENLVEQAMRYDLDLHASYWVAAVVRMDEASPGPLLQQRELGLISAKNIMDENMERFCRFKSFLYSGHIVVIAMLDSKEIILDFVDRMNRMCKIANRFLDIGLSAGVGQPCNQLTGLRQSYLGALRAVDYRVLMGANQAIYIGDMEPSTTAQLHFDAQDERELLGVIKLGSEQEIKSTVDKLIHRFEQSMLPFNQYQIFLMEMLTALINLARDYQLEMDEVFGSGFKGYAHLTDFDCLASLNQWFYESCLTISTMIKRERVDAAKLTVEKARQFVDENYGNSEISVEMLCNHLHMSPAYFSTVFKRESGVSFVNYLTSVRMEQAVKLLNSTEEKTYSICALVGYTDPNYFSYVFKKHFGVSPSKYRSK